MFVYPCKVDGCRLNYSTFLSVEFSADIHTAEKKEQHDGQDKRQSAFQECPSKTIRSNMNPRKAVTTEDTHPSIKLGHSDLKSFVFFLIQLLFDVKIL